MLQQEKIICKSDKSLVGNPARVEAVLTAA